MSTHDRQKVQSQLTYIGDDALVHATVERLLSQKRLLGDLRRIGRADFKPKLSTNLRKLKDVLIEAYRAGKFTPPDPASFVNRAGGNAAHLHDLFDVCVAEGHLARVTDDIYLHADADATMKQGSDGGRHSRHAGHVAQVCSAPVRISGSLRDHPTRG
jgi:selenocysteine-specific elongation factor